MKQELAGIPLWIWGIGAAVVVGGYLWIRHSQGQSGASPAPASTNTGKSTVHETITDFQGGGGTPKPKHKPKPKTGA